MYNGSNLTHCSHRERSLVVMHTRARNSEKKRNPILKRLKTDYVFCWNPKLSFHKIVIFTEEYYRLIKEQLRAYKHEYLSFIACKAFSAINHSAILLWVLLPHPKHVQNMEMKQKMALRNITGMNMFACVLSSNENYIGMAVTKV